MLISKALLDELHRQPKGSNLVINDKFIKNIASSIIYQARGYAINNRKITVTNDKLKRDTQKVSASGRSSASLFSTILTLVRQKAKHRGITTPKVGSDEWLAYKDATKYATEFCQEFGLNLKEGYHTYIQLGLEKMKNFSIYKFKTLHGPITRTYEAIAEIQADKHAQQTKELHTLYLTQVANRTGFSQSYENNPEKYVCFTRAAGNARDLGASLAHYISAQFEGFEWCNSIPDPVQLYGDKAKERVIKYYFAQGLKLRAHTTTIDFKKIKTQ